MTEPIHNSKGTHGPYKAQFECAQELKQVIRKWASSAVRPVHFEALEMDAVKTSRILLGDPDFPDHWEDKAGYALRVVGK
jgi:hypothetical protein